MGNELVMGSGLWFEPYTYVADEEYMGPYVYKEGSGVTTTYDYTNAEYDYFSQEYYTMCVNAKEAQFTDPYYDPTSDVIMSTCACPIIVDGKYMGNGLSLLYTGGENGIYIFTECGLTIVLLLIPAVNKAMTKVKNMAVEGPGHGRALKQS